MHHPLLQESMKQFQWFVLLFCVFLMLLGATVITVSLWLRQRIDADLAPVFGVEFEVILWFLCVVGGGIIVVAVGGCRAAIHEYRLLLKLIAGLVIALVVIQLFLFLWVISCRIRLHRNATHILLQTLQDYSTRKNIQKLFDTSQKRYNCCGVRGFKDYLEVQQCSPPPLRDNPCTCPVPPSCCKNISLCLNPSWSKQVTCGTKGSDTPFYNAGCQQELANQLHTSIDRVVNVTLSLGVVQVLGVIFAYCLARNIHPVYDPL